MRATFVGDAPDRARLGRRLGPFVRRLGEELDRPRCSLAVMLTGDEGIRDYNRRFRDRNEPTDVLAFPTGEGDPDASGHYLGDLVVSVERAAEQAAEQGHAVEDELEVLLLHGVLHLLGHDHETDDGAMRALEADLARRLFGSARGLVERGAD